MKLMRLFLISKKQTINPSRWLVLVSLTTLRVLDLSTSWHSRVDYTPFTFLQELHVGAYSNPPTELTNLRCLFLSAYEDNSVPVLPLLTRLCVRVSDPMLPVTLASMSSQLRALQIRCPSNRDDFSWLTSLTSLTELRMNFILFL